MAETNEVINETKKRIKKARPDYDLHVALLIKRLGLTKSEAQTMAYLDGVLGLDGRMAGRDPDPFNGWDKPPAESKAPTKP